MHIDTTFWVYKEDKVIEVEVKAPTLGFGNVYLRFLSSPQLRLYFRPETVHNLADAFEKIAGDLRRISNEQRAAENAEVRETARLRQPLGEDGPLPEAPAPIRHLPSGKWDC